ncbi:hypothetical protein [Emticicia sp. W12TSBA100-4]|uniref:hypothetical protein n=1 Tax=Emticicia sp. W12TSBA100-4 TaxID=3160965 RepID=UPI0033061C26
MAAQNQTTFVDTTDYGKIDDTSLAREISKYEALSEASKEQLKKGLANVEIWEWMFREILDRKRAFTIPQFQQFKMAIQYYKDLEDEARRNKAVRINASRARQPEPLRHSA